jgi:hypothetical protein
MFTGRHLCAIATSTVSNYANFGKNDAIVWRHRHIYNYIIYLEKEHVQYLKGERVLTSNLLKS